MASVNVQSNPDIVTQGTRDGDGVIISHNVGEESGLIHYEIENIRTQDVITIDSAMTADEGGNIIDVTRNWLKIILPFRTKFRARVKSQFGDFSNWINFKTRAKRYQTPHSITSLTDDTDSTAQTQGYKIGEAGRSIPQGGSRTIVVTNNAKATEQDNLSAAYNTPRNWGAATVTNTDTIYADGQLQTATTGERVPVKFTNRGATVINVQAGRNASITYTARGATINTIRNS